MNAYSTPAASGVYARLVGETVLVVVRGVMQIANIRRMRTAVVEAKPADKVLIDLRGAVLCASRDDWHTLQGESFGAPFMDVRVGFLVCEPQYADMWDHCLKMLHKGYTRLVFKSPESAADWAQMPAELLGRRPSPPGLAPFAPGFPPR